MQIKGPAVPSLQAGAGFRRAHDDVVIVRGAARVHFIRPTAGHGVVEDIVDDRVAGAAGAVHAHAYARTAVDAGNDRVVGEHVVLDAGILHAIAAEGLAAHAKAGVVDDIPFDNGLRIDAGTALRRIPIIVDAAAADVEDGVAADGIILGAVGDVDAAVPAAGGRVVLNDQTVFPAGKDR